MTVSRLIARPMLASIFLVGGVNALRNAASWPRKAEPVTDRLVPLVQQGRAPAARSRGPGHAGPPQRRASSSAPALALATGRAPRLSAAVLAASLVPTTVGRPPVLGGSRTRRQRTQQQLHFFKNVSMLGGLMIAAGDTEGKPGVAWRARRAAKRRPPRGQAPGRTPPAARPGSRRPSSPDPRRPRLRRVTDLRDPWPAPARQPTRSTRSSRCPAASR